MDPSRTRSNVSFTERGTAFLGLTCTGLALTAGDPRLTVTVLATGHANVGLRGVTTTSHANVDFRGAPTTGHANVDLPGAPTTGHASLYLRGRPNSTATPNPRPPA